MHHQKKISIIFPVSMKRIGLLFHFSEMAIEFSKKLSGYENYELLILSEQGEQNEGLWEKLKSHVPEEEIKIVSDYKKFSSVIEGKLASQVYRKVIVLTQGLMQFLDLISFKKKYKEKLFLYTRLNSFKHGSRYRPLLTKYFARKFCQYADYVNFQCCYTADIFVDSDKIFKKNIGGFIPLGLSKEVIKEPDNLELCKLFEDKSAVKIVYLAQFHKHKGHEELISILADTLRKNKKAYLIFLGDGARYQQIRALSCELGIESSVIMPGRVHRQYVPWILTKSDLSLVWSKVETFGHNILEPLFYGTPVVSTDVGIAREVIRDYHNGFLLREERHQAVGYIKSFIESKCLRESLQEKVMNADMSDYSWSSIVDRYLLLFDRISSSD